MILFTILLNKIIEELLHGYVTKSIFFEGYNGQSKQFYSINLHTPIKENIKIWCKIIINNNNKN